MCYNDPVITKKMKEEIATKFAERQKTATNRNSVVSNSFEQESLQDQSFLNIEKEDSVDISGFSKSSIHKEEGDLDSEVSNISESDIFINISADGRENTELIKKAKGREVQSKLKKSLSIAKTRRVQMLKIEDSGLTRKDFKQDVRKLEGYDITKKALDRFVDSFSFAKKQLDANKYISAPVKDVRLLRLIEPYMSVNQHFLNYYSDDHKLMPDKYREYFDSVLEISKRHDTFLQYQHDKNSLMKCPYTRSEMEEHERYLNLKEKVHASLERESNDETLGKVDDRSVTEQQEYGLHCIDQWLVRNLNHSSSVEVGSFVSNILSLSNRERLFIYYVIEKKKRHSATAMDIQHSQQEDYVPDLDVFRDVMTASRFRIFKRMSGNYIYWNKLEDAVNLMNQNRSTLNTFLISEGEDQKDLSPESLNLLSLSKEISDIDQAEKNAESEDPALLKRKQDAADKLVALIQNDEILKGIVQGSSFKSKTAIAAAYSHL